MNPPKLGSLAETTGVRDAIHIAVLSGAVKEDSYPGDAVGICADGEFSTIMPEVGIVDPFLPPYTNIPKGTPVWVFLKPNSISGLRHVWTHPEIPDEKPAAEEPPAPPPIRSEAEVWLREYAVRVNPYITNPEDAFKKLVAEAREGTVFFYGLDCHGSDDVDPEFFHHMSLYLGQNITPESLEYRCSC